MPRRVIFIGREDFSEFKSAIDWLQQHVSLSRAEQIDAAIEQLSDGNTADIVLVAPSYRTEFTLDDVRGLQTVSPLSQLYVVVGSWCEGETRSGQAWPAIERLYVHQLIARAQSDRWDCASFDLPATPCTASADERWMSRADRSPSSEAGWVLICGRDTESRLALVDLCRWAGWQAVSMKSPRGTVGHPVAVIYDADRNRQQRCRDLQRLSAAWPDARVLTLIEYPRHDEIRQALDAGSDDVLGKPYDIDDLLTLVVGAAGEVKGRETPVHNGSPSPRGS